MTNLIKVFCPNDKKDIHDLYICKDHINGYEIPLDEIKNSGIIKCMWCDIEYMQKYNTENIPNYIRQVVNKTRMK